MADPGSEKLLLLSSAARFDVCAACGSAAQVDARDVFSHSITRIFRPDGTSVSVFKVLMTDACRYDCLYCANRAGRPRGRHSFTPDELASTFMDLYQRGLVTGLFLSSGIRGSAAETMDDMLTAAEILREKRGFEGYLHLKILPRAPYDCVERAVELADRVSVNMEAPTQRSLDRLSTKKQQSADIIQRMHWIRRAAERAGPGTLRSGQTTQFVVGPAGESDREILGSVAALRRSVGLSRAYFSAFSPVDETPLADEPPTPPLRQHRLSQAEWLLREYGFDLSDIHFDGQGGLPLDLDPKLAFALGNLERFPIEVNSAARDDLLKVPGIGPRSVGRLLAARVNRRVTSLGELRGLGVVTRRAAPFLLCDGRRMGHFRDVLKQQPASPEQLELALGEAAPATRRRASA